MSEAAENPVRRLTNLELWHSLLEGKLSHDPGAVEREFEWRLRKIGFLPALPPKEDGQ